MFLLTVLSLGALRPILGNRAPFADDYGYHVLRLAQLRHLVEQGVWFSRWMPDLAQGYGYPLFNYFAPLSYYLTLPFIFLTGSVNTGFQLALALGVVLSGCTMYLFMREYVRPPAAVIAAVAYMYAPYYSYDLLFRANIGEAMGFFWMPLALWGMRRIATSGAPFYIAVTALAYAAVILTHNVFALIFSPILGLYGLLCVLFSNAQLPKINAQTGTRVRQFVQIVSAITLGLLLSIFFWFPAVYEQSAAAFDRLYGDPSYLYNNNFLSFFELFAGSVFVPTDLINPSPPPSLGIHLATVAAICVLFFWTAKRRNLPAIFFFALIAASVSALVLPVSEPIWQLLPLLQIIQFPWRLLAVGALAVAILCGFSAELFFKPISPQQLEKVPRFMRTAYVTYHMPISSAILVLAFILSSQAYLYPAYGPKPNTTVDDIIPWENATQTLGTTVAGEYLPKTVTEIPYGKPAQIIAEPVGYIARRESDPLRHTMTLQSDVDQTIIVNQFAFAGWHAYVDDEPVPITPSEPHGLITFPVTAGVRDIRVEFRETPMRLGLDMLSAAALLLCVGLLVRRRQPPVLAKPPSSSLEVRTTGLLLVAGLIGAFVFPTLRPTLLQADLTLADTDEVVSVQFANGMVLLGGDVEGRVHSADSTIPVTLYWRTTQPQSSDFEATVALRDQAGVLYSAKTAQAPRRFRQAYGTSAWTTDQVAKQQLLVQPVPGTPMGSYELVVTLFDKATLQPIPVQGSTQTQPSIADVTIASAQQAAQVAPRNRLNLDYDSGVKLIGFEQDREQARSGETVLLTLYWQSDATREVMPSVLLGGERVVAPSSFVFDRGQFQTRHQLRVPRALPFGVAAWQVVGPSGPLAVGEIGVDAPERVEIRPNLTNPYDASFGFATLTGYELEADANTLLLRLAWESVAETDISYRVFVHLLDVNGNILTQSDAEPANWTRPTTGWLTGEFILDEHSLSGNIDAATALRIGFYEGSTGTRSAEPITIPLP